MLTLDVLSPYLLEKCLGLIIRQSQLSFIIIIIIIIIFIIIIYFLSFKIVFGLNFI